MTMSAGLPNLSGHFNDTIVAPQVISTTSIRLLFVRVYDLIFNDFRSPRSLVSVRASSLSPDADSNDFIDFRDSLVKPLIKSEKKKTIHTTL